MVKHKMSEEHDKLKAEAEYQNKRSRGELERHNVRRGKFYYLIKNAWVLYHKVMDENTKDKRIIVVGCAEGGVTPLAKKGAKMVLGIDIADEPVKKLNESIKAEGLEDRAKAIVGNAEQLDLPEQSYDLICCSGVLHHLDVELSMQSWSKTLTKDGLVLMMEPMAMNPIIYLYRVLTPSMRTDDEHPLLPKDIKVLRKYFNKVTVNGFVLTSIFSLIFAYLPNIFSLKEKTFKMLESLDRGLLKIFPGLVYLCWTSIIVLEEPVRDDKGEA